MQVKLLIVSAMLCGAASVSHGQILNVGSIQRITTTLPVDRGEISPDGKTIIVSTLNDDDLWRVDPADGASRRLAPNGLISDLRWNGNDEVVFQRATFDRNNRRFKESVAIDLGGKAERRLCPPARDPRPVLLDNRPSLSTSQSPNLSTSQPPVAYIYQGELRLKQGESDIALNPQGKEGMSYIWPSVSPDGSKVLYYLVGSGAYVCGIDGSDPRALGELHAARWIDNETVVGMRDHDDGMFFTDSAIIAKTLDGTEQTLTPDTLIAMYPTVTAAGDIIVFSTPEGALYTITITR